MESQFNNQNLRPDIGYVQGMSYIVIFLLIFMEPLNTYKMFSTLILTSEFIFNWFSFDKDYVNKINLICSVLIQKLFPNLYEFFTEVKIDIWEVFIIEVILI